MIPAKARRRFYGAVNSFDALGGGDDNNLPGLGHESHVGDWPLVAFEPVEACLIDHIPNNQGGVFRSGH